ncbi:MAG: ribose-5-phosphate isomerase RpiA [Parachlamydiaceae bacterium]
MRVDTTNSAAKKAAGQAAALLVRDGMVLGLGTGSTANCFIDSLIERTHTSRLNIRVVATSESSAARARAGGIIVEDPNKITLIDLTIDGADEIDTHKRMIKGGGGALLREKIIASLSQEMVVIIDESKLVSSLGGFPLPLEVVPFAYVPILQRVRGLGYQGSMRLTKDGFLYTTDNGNYIIDISFAERCCDPERDEAILKGIPGILETGFFFGMAGRVLVGYRDGTVKILT